MSFRPTNLNEIVGQEHLTSKDSPFYKLINSQNIPHLIFFGSAGSGKTTMAKIIAKGLDTPFYEMDATNIKVQEIRNILDRHKNSLIKPVIFIDEVHRLSKTQQEVLLIPMERREAIIIGASTENPYYTLTSGIRSRSMLFEFKSVSKEAMKKLLDRVKDSIEFEIDEDAREYLLSSSAGDCRAMLNLLEYALAIEKDITIKTLKSLRPTMLKDGVSSDDTHYDLASAFIKSMRGSDVDATLYYLARLIDGGEDPAFIARRMVIFASEDIGNANPNALNLAVSSMTAVSKIGYPESRIILSQCAVYLASSPKSNSSYRAINKALEYISTNPSIKVPSHLLSPPKDNYLYPHDFGGWVEQEYLPVDAKFYESSKIGFEKSLDEWLEKIKGLGKDIS